LTKALGELTKDALSRIAAEAWADSLRETYKDYPHFQAAVFHSTAAPRKGEVCGGSAFVVRTNLINGLPPTKPTEIQLPDAEYLKRLTRKPNQVAA
jgi:hypothetical protein